MSNKEQDVFQIVFYDQSRVIADGITQQWRRLNALDIASNRRVMNNIRVGIVVIDKLIKIDLLESFLCAYSNIFWIALLEEDLLERQEVRFLLKNYFYNFHTQPLSVSCLQHMIAQALVMAKLCYKKSIDSIEAHSNDDALLGESQSMQMLKRQVDKAAGCSLPVLITGESGTGKEVVARRLHAHSAYAQGPFIAVNCGALSPQLVQSELFGHEKGAFTGAGQRKIGKFEAAHQGTLFLDEIGDLPLEEQVNLLRFLQEKTIERVGSHQAIPLDVRVVAATHVNLELAIQEGRFREDLYFRLNVIRLKIPPLRQREEDVLLLAKCFLRQQLPPQRMGFSESAEAALLQYSWPGNVRELINRVQRANVMASGRYIQPRDLELELVNSQVYGACLKEIREVAERDALSRALDESQGKASLVAKRLNISRATLYRLLGKHSLL